VGGVVQARRWWLAAALLLVACGGEAPEQERAAAPDPLLSAPPSALSQSLAVAAGQGAYSVDSAAAAQGGWLRGTVSYDGELPADTLVRPTHDTRTCRAVPDAPFVGTRDALGDAIVWLVGVTHGPADRDARRVAVSLTNCRIEPRITRAPLGATLLVRSADAIDARLRFVDVEPEHEGPITGDSTPIARAAAPTAPRALVPLADAGAVVPLTEVTARPGLVEIRDDRHPWVRGWIAVAPHPFVAITDASGRFAFDGVPPGRYVLVTWHERLGSVAIPVLVERGIEARVTVALPERR
jgi:hypothetical protein